MALCEYGIFGLGVMGGNLTLNLARQGVSVAAYDKDRRQVERILKRASELGITPSLIHACPSAEIFVKSVKRPRRLHIEVNEKQLRNAVLELVEWAEPGDLLIDGGNSFYKETQRIADDLVKSKELMYLAMGVSGGEEAALNGACIMAGGTRAAYELEREYIEKLALKTDDGSAMAFWTSRDPKHDTEAGHFVKMVHNGIEYAILQLIAETVNFLQEVLSLSTEEAAQC